VPAELHPKDVKGYRYSGKAGDVITVKATDDFHVQGVAVEVVGLTGKLLEKGEAERYRSQFRPWGFLDF
jgi:hypothetical protein